MEQLTLFKKKNSEASFKEETSIVEVFGDIPDNLTNNSYLNVFRKNKKSIHNIALYPCKFIPELPNWAIRNFSRKGDTVLDPFCGGGTSLIEATKLDRNSLGFDYNPYAILISKVKTRFYSYEELNGQLTQLLKSFRNENESIETPNWRGIEFWFNQDVIRGLNVIKKHINLISDEKLRDFYKVVFSMVVRKSSYIAPGQILTARRKDYKDCKQYTETEVYGIFKQYADEYINYVLKFTHNSKDISSFCRVSKGDARDINVQENVDLIVSSPPYINAMDYVWANRLRIHWLDLVESDKDRLELYAEEIGTERIKSSVYSEIGKTGYKSIDKTIEQIYNSFESNQQSKLRSRVAYKYFIDMEKHFQSAYNALKKGGKYCIVIGDNNIRKVNVQTTNFLIEMASKIGFEKEFQFNILLKNRSLNVDRKLDFADLIKYDRMIVLSK